MVTKRSTPAGPGSRNQNCNSHYQHDQNQTPDIHNLCEGSYITKFKNSDHPNTQVQQVLIITNISKIMDIIILLGIINNTGNNQNHKYTGNNQSAENNHFT